MPTPEAARAHVLRCRFARCSPVFPRQSVEPCASLLQTPPASWTRCSRTWSPPASSLPRRSPRARRAGEQASRLTARRRRRRRSTAVGDGSAPGVATPLAAVQLRRIGGNPPLGATGEAPRQPGALPLVDFTRPLGRRRRRTATILLRAGTARRHRRRRRRGPCASLRLLAGGTNAGAGAVLRAAAARAPRCTCTICPVRVQKARVCAPVCWRTLGDLGGWCT